MNVLKLTIFFFFLSLFSISFTNANTHEESLNFNNYPSKDNSNYEHANFAGHYSVSIYGCGGGAICGDIKNLLTKNVVGLPNAYLIEDESGKNGFLINYHRNSRLIIISGILADPDEEQKNEGFKRRYYQFVDDKFILLKTQ